MRDAATRDIETKIYFIIMILFGLAMASLIHKTAVEAYAEETAFAYQNRLVPRLGQEYIAAVKD